MRERDRQRAEANYPPKEDFIYVFIKCYDIIYNWSHCITWPIFYLQLLQWAFHA